MKDAGGRKQVEQGTNKSGLRIDIYVLLPFIAFIIAYLLIPRFVVQKQLTTLIYIGIYALLALGLNLLMGYAGQISLGHAAFFGLGAYTSAILTVRPVVTEVIPGLSLGVGVMVGCAVLISLTRASGWKLACGIGGLLVISWAIRLLDAGWPLAMVVAVIIMAVVGVITRVGVWKAVVAGAASVLGAGISSSFLTGVLERGGISPWTAMFVGVFITGLIAYLIGGQVLRLKGHYLAMGTLGFGIIVEIVFRQWTAVTGGSSDGIYGIPSIEVLDALPGFARRLAELLVGGQVTARHEYYFLVWAFVFLALVFAVNVVRSRVGRAFRAVHGSEQAAETLGVDTERYKVQIFVISAGMASIAGSLHAHNAGIGYIHPNEFSFMVSIQLVAMVVIGGMASVWGSLFGATSIELLHNWMLSISKSHATVFGLTLRGLDPVVFGGILIVVMVVMPQGLVRGLTDMAAASLRSARRASAKDTG